MKHDKLIKRIYEEHDEYIESLRQEKPDEIIRKSYETCYREEFISILESDIFDEKVYDALLEVPNPVGILYDEWMKTDASVCDMLIEVIERFGEEQ